MEIRPSDLIQLKKDIERIRRHEESRRSPQTDESSSQSVESDISQNAKRSVPVPARIRELIASLWGPPAPSRESLEAIPEYLVTLVQVIREEPKFRRWLLQLEGMPLSYRNQELAKMSRAFRIEDANSPVAAAFDRLHDPPLFQAVCKYLSSDAV
jgi:hypothetical protein